MTGRQRLLKVVAGEVPDRVPFAPNIGQWFQAHQARGTLPEMLRDCGDEVDAMKRLGCDIFSRRCGNFVRVEHPGIEESWTRGPSQNQLTHSIQTPHGELRGVTESQPDSATDFEREHIWKDFETDYPAIRELISSTHYHFDVAKYREADQRVGEYGLVIISGQQAPLKRMINLAGAENAFFWIDEHESRMRELMEIHTERCLEFAREVADSDAVGMMSMDNLDSLFYSPAMFDNYCHDYYRRIGEVLHARGKFWCSHACGRVASLRDRVAAVELDGLEGTPHAPLGDIELSEFRASIPYKRHIVWGGMTCHEQEILSAAKTRIYEHVKGLFAGMRPFDRFVYSSACNTSIKTPFDNLLYFRDACWSLGRA